MKTSYSILALITIILLLGFSSCSSNRGGSQEEKKPNVLIIVADDLGYGDISCYNSKNIKTPNIDGLAQAGVKCTDFYVPTPYCAPSRATLLTGRFPLHHGLIRNPTPDAGINDIGILQSEITLAEVMQDVGYHTSCIGKWHMGHKEEFFPVNHGFDEYYGILYSNDMRPVQIVENKDTVEYPVDQSLLTKKYTDKAIEFISENKEKPFFLHLCHAMPHKPLAASERFYTPETPNDLYADVIRELDWAIGEVIGKLKELKILDNTIVIFMSDNGPWYGGNAGGLKGMKATTWEGGTRVPFIVHYPKVFPKGIEINTPCWSPDIFPTLLSLTDVRPSESNKLDGEDVTELLQGKKQTHAPVFSMRGEHIMTVRDGDYKLFVREPKYTKLPDDWVDPRGPDKETIIAPKEQATPNQYPGIMPEKPQSSIQLFNLRKDISESNNIASNHPEVVEELMRKYEDFKRRFKL